MSDVLNKISGPVRVNGDGRFDSPGHSAMFGIYTMMEAGTSKILSSNLVKVSFFRRLYND